MGGTKGKYQTPAQKAVSDVAHVADHTVREKAMHVGVHNASKIASNVGKTVAKVAPNVIPSMVKAAPAIARVGIPLATKIAGPLLGGTAGTISAMLDGRGYGADFMEVGDARKTGGGTMAGLNKRAAMGRPKYNITKKMATVKSPAYPGQSTMGKAVMASAKKKV
jgi:hypothetical protein